MKLTFPFFLHKAGAGFPSPATDYIEEDIDLNACLIKNSPATFIIRVQGKSMNSVGIYDGDLLIVDRSINPKTLSTVIANVNDALVVKTIIKEKGETFLTSGSKKKSDKINLVNNEEATKKAIELNNGVRRIPVIIFADNSILVEPNGEELKAKMATQ